MKTTETQKEADDYMDGWGARHHGLALNPIASHEWQTGWEDCDKGTIDANKIMGPEDIYKL